VLERWKFTHVMVGHVHLALAGVCTSLCVLILQGLDVGFSRRNHVARKLGARGAAWMWNGGLAVHVAALTWLGQLETTSPQILWSSDASASTAVSALFAVRWLGGAAMAGASVAWCLGCLRCLPAAEPITHTAVDKERHEPAEQPERIPLAPDLLSAGR
jgi:hypothetical protein